MNNVSKTLYIPLYGKAYVSRRGLFISDKSAEEIWEKEGFKLRGKSASKWLAYYMGIRSGVFDEWLLGSISDETVILHLGCGLDSRVARVGNLKNLWYDIDFAEVIEERKKYFKEDGRYKMISADIRDSAWLNLVEGKRAVVVMEGISMYLSESELSVLIKSLDRRFDKIDLLMDCYTSLAARMSKIKNPINDVGVRDVYGIDDPTKINYGEIKFIREHKMTPPVFVDQLKGFEKYIFKKIYAGSFSNKLYRLYEYKKG